MQQHFRPASPDDARRVITTEAARRTLVVYFNRRTDGRDRRMVCRYFPEAAGQARFPFNPVERHLLPVWDMEKGARRFISLDRVEEITWNEPEARPAAPDRQPFDRAAAERRLQALREWMAQDFY